MFYPASPQNITIDVNPSTMTASIMADLGFQGYQKFMLSTTSQFISTFSTDCQTVGVGQVSCDTEPNFATNYFNMTTGAPLAAENVTIDGYVLQGYAFNQSICLASISTDYFCTYNDDLFFVANTLVSNDWNFASPSTAGIIGLGEGSPIWKMTGAGSDSEQLYYIQFSNVTDLTFADASYVPTYTGNSISIG